APHPRPEPCIGTMRGEGVTTHDERTTAHTESHDMSKNDAILIQIAETRDEYIAAMADHDETAAAGAADMYITLRRWGQSRGLDVPPLRIPTTVMPEDLAAASTCPHV